MTIIVAGLSPLLNLCASGLTDKAEEIHFLLYQNTYDTNRFAVDDELTAEFAVDIANSLGYKLKFCGPYKWYCPPADERSLENPITAEIPEVTLGQENLISANAEMFLSPILKRRSVTLFPEGASCFAGITPAENPTQIWEKTIRPRLSLAKRRLFGLPYYLRESWLLTDLNGVIRERIGSRYGYSVLPEKRLFANYNVCARYLAQKYPEMDFRTDEKIYFHPLVETLNRDAYKIWMEELFQTYGDCRLFVKSRPRDKSDYPDVFSDFETISMPRRFRQLPGELVICQTQMEYLGFYSSLMLSFERSKIHLVTPPDHMIESRYNEIYIGLRKFFLDGTG